MKQQGSYNIGTISSSAGKEILRLKAQVELFWEQELDQYRKFGLSDGISVVELGSGPGFTTAKMLATFPTVQITAVEIDPSLVVYAREHLLPFEKRCEIVQCSITDTGLPENTFDFALTRLVLEHLPDPVAAIREVVRILKPGARAVFVDNDFDMHIMTFPHIVALKELYDAYCKSSFAAGGNPKIGRELPTLLKMGGLSAIHFEVINAHSGVIGSNIFLNSEGIGIPSRLVQEGFLSSKVLAQIAVEWRNMIKNEHRAILRQLYLAAGEKQAEKE